MSQEKLDENFLETFITRLKEPLDKIKTLSEEEISQMHTAAYSFYSSGHYGQAAKLFLQLLLSNPYEKMFWEGFAGSLQMDKKFEEALQGWAMTALLANDDPLPHFHAAECLYFLDNREEVLKALLQAEKRTKKEEKTLIQKIELLREMSKGERYV